MFYLLCVVVVFCHVVNMCLRVLCFMFTCLMFTSTSSQLNASNTSTHREHNIVIVWCEQYMSFHVWMLMLKVMWCAFMSDVDVNKLCYDVWWWSVVVYWTKKNPVKTQTIKIAQININTRLTTPQRCLCLMMNWFQMKYWPAIVPKYPKHPHSGTMSKNSSK